MQEKRHDCVVEMWLCFFSRKAGDYKMLFVATRKCRSTFGCGVIGKVVRVTADESVMEGDKLNMSLVNAIAFDPYTHGYYKVTDRIGEAFKDGLKLKK